MRPGIVQADPVLSSLGGRAYWNETAIPTDVGIAASKTSVHRLGNPFQDFQFSPQTTMLDKVVAAGSWGTP